MFPSSSDKELKRCSGGQIEPCEGNAGEVVNKRAITDERFKMEVYLSCSNCPSTAAA